MIPVVAAFIISGWLWFLVLLICPGSGTHRRPGQRRERLAELGGDLVTLALIAWLYATLRLRPALRLAEAETPAPAVREPGRGVPQLPPGARLAPYKDPNGTRPQYSVLRPSWDTDPAVPVGATTGELDMRGAS